MTSLTRKAWSLLAALFLVWGAMNVALAQQQPKQDDKVKISQGEDDLRKKIQAAKTLPEKFALAQKLLEKYPKSPLRPQFAGYLIGEIGNIQDPEQRISQIEAFLSSFTEASEQEMAIPYLVEAYITARRWDDAFGLAPRVLDKDPANNFTLLTQLGISGGELVFGGNTQYLAQAQKYAAQAIELIETDKKPAQTSADFWANYKKQSLPSLYQSQGIMARATRKNADARAALAKAIALNPSNPVSYLVLALIADDEYQALAKQYNITPIGKERDALLTKVEGKMDEAIMLYAQAAGKASLNPGYKALQDQIMLSLQEYYKYRHKGSLDGLQALIDKYKN